MKLLRYGPPGREKPGLLDENGVIRDLCAHIDDLSGELLGREALARLAALKTADLPVVKGHPRLGAPVAGTRCFIGVGLNYADHAKEAGMAIPEEPVLFNKAANAICGPNDDVIRPRQANKLDYEVELAFVIGERAAYVDEVDAQNYIAGYCICNDVSERGFQIERGGQWVKGKSAETFGPLGPWLVTPDEAGDVQDLQLSLSVNGEIRQSGSTRKMIFSVPFLLHYISQFMVLEPGDVVTTGTPPGVALGQNPPQWLQPGDEVMLEVAGLGQQRQRIIACAAADRA